MIDFVQNPENEVVYLREKLHKRNTILGCVVILLVIFFMASAFLYDLWVTEKADRIFYEEFAAEQLLVRNQELEMYTRYVEGVKSRCDSLLVHERRSFEKLYNELINTKK